MKTPSYKIIDHTADLGIQVQASSPKELFIKAGLALMDLLIKTRRGVQLISPDQMTISLEGTDIEDLMVRWLGEILYIFETEHLVISSINIGAFQEDSMEARLTSIPFDSLAHEVHYEIKAVTYHQIKVAPRGPLWEARVFFDL